MNILISLKFKMPRKLSIISAIFLVLIIMPSFSSYALRIGLNTDSVSFTTSTDSSKESKTPHGIIRQEGKKSSKDAPPVVHPSIDTVVHFGSNKHIRLANKIQNYKGGPTHDPDILSPKSVNIHPSGKKFYVNSLEGGKTIVYSLPELEKLAVISHRFNSSHSNLWAPNSGLFKFRHYTNNINNFTGKPVESTFSHGGRYLWVPYYRRSFDINAQDPSALAVIDTSTDSIIRIMEAGVLPKMITISPDESTIAVAHWGDNTVGVIDVSSNDPNQWKYIANIAVGRQLFQDLSLTESVDRDKNSGEALRGSVFTPDGRYLLVGCMSGGGIAVIDVEKKKYLGKLLGMMPNVRHIVVKDGWLYASINVLGYVQRLRLSEIINAIEKFGESRFVNTSGWQTVKVAPGARTLELSPSGDYIFVACNFGSKICIVDSAMNKIADVPVDSYPVGLDVSPDGRWLISTSQGRNKFGGNCVDIFELSGLQIETSSNDNSDQTNQSINKSADYTSTISDKFKSILSFIRDNWIVLIITIAILFSITLIFKSRRKH